MATPGAPTRSSLARAGWLVALVLHASWSVAGAARAQATPPAVAIDDRVAELPGVRLRYLDTGGSGPVVVLLHAATGSRQVWEHQLSAFTAAGYRVIAYDRRGHGGTTVEAAAPVSTDADDLEALLAHLRFGRVHLVGTAAGGIVATDFALSFPDRLRSLVLTNTLLGIRDEEYLALGRRLRPPEFAALPPHLRELGPSYRADNPGGTERWLALERARRAPGPELPAQPPKNVVTFASLESLRVPTLLVTGGADLYMPPPLMRQIAGRIRGSETVVFDEVGHSAFWEQPEAFNRAVLAFLARH